MRIAALVIAVLATAGCHDKRERSAPPAAVAPDQAPTAEPVEPAPFAPTAAASIYDLELLMIDQANRPIGLDVHRGHVTLIAMFYGSCLTACPRLMHDVSELVAAVPDVDVRVLLVSFDAARDTPARLAELAQQHGFDPDRYRLAALREPDARTLAAVLGVKYRKLDDGEFFHNSIITALDRDGVPFARQDGFVDLAPMIASLEQHR